MMKDKRDYWVDAKTPLTVAGIFFGVFALIHLYRLIWFFPVLIGTFAVPYSYSVVAFVVALGLSIWFFNVCCSCCCRKECDVPDDMPSNMHSNSNMPSDKDKRNL